MSDEAWVHVPDDLSSLDTPVVEDKIELQIDACKINAMNFVIDAFTHPMVSQWLNDDMHICSYIRHLFPASITHEQMHERIVEYGRTYSALKAKYSKHGVVYEGPIFDQMVAEYRYVLLPILERE